MNATSSSNSRLLDIQSHIVEGLKKESGPLEKIKASDEPLIEKWQKFLQVILPIQMKAVQKFGYPEDQTGVSQFNEQWLVAAAQDQVLRNLNEEKWRYIFEKAFGLKEGQPLTLEQAQNLIKDIAVEMTSEDFLQKVDELDDALPFVEKRQQLLTVLLPLHMSIMARHGFEGEEGYIQAQRALMEYYHDPVIMEKANHAQKVVFSRAKLLDI